jgi:hypothetical protein
MNAKYLECAKEQLQLALALQTDHVGKDAAIAAALRQIEFALSETKPSRNMETLTQEQAAALIAYAAQHGRTWKSELRADWFSGRTVGELQQIRNEFGPAWLTRFDIKKPFAVYSQD